MGAPVDFRDLNSIDSQLYKMLLWIMSSDADMSDLELYFDFLSSWDSHHSIAASVCCDEKLTSANKLLYGKLKFEHRVLQSIKCNVKALLNGFYQIIPLNLIAVFTPKELELLLNGLPRIDVDNWRRNTVYRACADSDDIIRY